MPDSGLHLPVCWHALHVANRLQSALWKQQPLLVSLGLALAGTCLLKVPVMLPAVCLIEGTLLFLPSTVVHKVQNASDTLFRYEVG